MKGDKKIIEILNSLLAGELTAVDQYLIHGEMYADLGLTQVHFGIHDKLAAATPLLAELGVDWADVAALAHAVAALPRLRLRRAHKATLQRHRTRRPRWQVFACWWWRTTAPTRKSPSACWSASASKPG